ncbi:hypothetical protein T06_15816 [Trichinella sp. T6]|nr:hypothetical protein T06_15816 [Trichinella sp. T6]
MELRALPLVLDIRKWGIPKLSLSTAGASSRQSPVSGPDGWSARIIAVDAHATVSVGLLNYWARSGFPLSEQLSPL